VIPKNNFLWLFEFHSSAGWPSGKNGLAWRSAEGETGKEITGFTPSHFLLGRDCPCKRQQKSLKSRGLP